jgi:electron transport complex protein RnfD
VAIAVAKELFGGLGHNIFNPAIFGRVFITSFLPFFPTYYLAPLWWKKTSFFNFLIPSGVKMENNTLIYRLIDNTGQTVIDAISTATPLKLIKTGALIKPTYLELFLGTVKGGNLGETCIVALLIGAAYLLYKKHIDLTIPLSIILTTFFVTWICGQDPLYHILAGGLILGAFFMATDWVTSPMTTKGKLLYGIGIGLFVSLIRLFGSKPEGVAIGILHMNVLALFIDRLFLPKKFGEIR